LEFQLSLDSASTDSTNSESKIFEEKNSRKIKKKKQNELAAHGALC
jgi:hypothetical protein